MCLPPETSDTAARESGGWGEQTDSLSRCAAEGRAGAGRKATGPRGWERLLYLVVSESSGGKDYSNLSLYFEAG